MLPLQVIAKVPVIVPVCNYKPLKREILSAPHSDYESNRHKSDISPRKLWNSVVEEKAIAVFRRIAPRSKQFLQGIICFVPAIGMRMLIWAEYHERILDIPREYSVEFLNRSFFTRRGIIDNVKTARALIADENLTIKQKYKLACVYCLTDHIRDLFSEMTEDDRKRFCSMTKWRYTLQPELVRFWTALMMQKGNRLPEEQLDQFGFQNAVVESGNTSAFEYWLDKTGSRENDAIVNAAVETIQRKIIAEWYMLHPHGIDDMEWRVIRENQMYCGTNKFWTPRDHYVDVVVFLLSEMNNEQKVSFLKRDLRGAEYKKSVYIGFHSWVLDIFLNWPYQDLFMQTARLMWEFFPGNCYTILLHKIADKIEHRDDDGLNYGEEMTYNYKELLMEFWEESSDDCKRYVLRDERILKKFSKRLVKTCTELLRKLFTLSKVPREHIKMILKSATIEEKDNIFSWSSSEWIDICIYLMKEKWEELDVFVVKDLLKYRGSDNFKRVFTSLFPACCACVELMEHDKWATVESFIKWCASPEDEAELRRTIASTEAWKRIFYTLMDKEDWGRLDEILLKFFLSRENASDFKRELASKEDIRNFCISDFIENGRLDAAESFLKWTALTEDEVNEVKRTMVSSPRAIMTCYSLFKKFKGFGVIDRFIRWHNPPEEEVKEFKRSLIFSDEGIQLCIEFAENDKLELANEITTYCLSTEDEIKDFKRKMALENGSQVLLFILTGGNTHFDDMETEFEGCDWVLAEKFLTWCFSSEKEINNYKGNLLLSDFAYKMKFYLIHHEKWEEAKKFRAWLRSSPEEIDEPIENAFLFFQKLKRYGCSK